MHLALQRGLVYRFGETTTRLHLKSRSFATTVPRFDLNADYPVTDVAVIGGGITGLTSAFYLNLAFPSAKITVFESSDRFGGWVRSSKLDIGGKHVYFEHGPRTLRPAADSMVTFDLIERLKLSNDILTTSKDSPAALNRYIYYPDHLVRLPTFKSSLSEWIRFFRNEPIAEGLIGAFFRTFIRDVLTGRSRDPPRKYLEDESLDSFVSRRASPILADRFLSAFFHGVYAGDIDKLSALCIMPSMKLAEAYHGSSLRMTLANRLRGRQWTPMVLYDVLRQLESIESKHKELVEDKMKDVNVFTIKGGLEKLARSLESHLREERNVTLCPRHVVAEITPSEPDQKLVTRIIALDSPEAAMKAQHFSHIVSTIKGSSLMAACSPPLLSSSQLEKTHAVTVMVVNLYYTDPNLNPYSGFGYLIPRCVPLEQNPELALGVVFDSESSVGLDSAEGTKLTVMLGGHWWDSLGGLYPSKAEGEKMALSVIARHLKIHQKPHAVRVSLQKECIPQYTVGHQERMLEAHKTLLRAYNGRVRISGSWFTGISFNSCIRSAFQLAMDLKDGKLASGLETMLPGGEKWANLPVLMKKSLAKK